MSNTMNHKNFSSYKSPHGWSLVWNQNDTESHQNRTNVNNGISDSSSEAYSSDTTSDSSIQYASTSRDESIVKQDKWFNPAQFVQSTAFPYFNGSTLYTPNRDMSMERHNDDSDSNCLLNSNASLDEFVTNTYNNMFRPPPPSPSPMPENIQASPLYSDKPKKRYRTAYTTEQTNAMEEVFISKAYLSKEEREKLCKRINVSEKAVKVWFQNRRMKEKRGEDCTQTYSILPHIVDEIEAAISECEVDEDLVCVPSYLVDRIGQLIHEYLPINVDHLDNLNNTDASDDNNDKSEDTYSQYIEYEDMSSAEDSTVELDDWKPKDEAEIKALFDLHFC